MNNNIRIMINVSEKLLKKLDNASKAFGLSRSAYVRTVLTKEVEKKD